MRQLLIAAVLSVVLCAAGSVQAKSASKGKGMTGTYQGTIMSVSRNSVSIDIGVDKPERVSVIVDDKTEVSGYGKKGTIADLARGQIVSVKIAKNHATSIDVTGVANGSDS